MGKGLNVIAGVFSIRTTALLSFIFFFSGFSALIYQVVWQRLLTVHYGVGPISITLIVSVYMVGLGLGALFGGYLAERTANKITLYFVIELLIGLFGTVSLPLLDFIGRHTAGSSYELSFIYMFAFLSLPTFLMGMTLPLLTKIFNRLIHDFLGSVSFLYYINTLGAAAGTLFASYFIISFFGLDVAAAIAVFINFILAALILLVRYSVSDNNVAKSISEPAVVENTIFGKIAYPLVFITGFLAIGYEIIWFRVIGVLTKTSPYAFSTVLSIYLLGIAIGSYGMNKYLRRYENIHKKSLFFLLQFYIGASVIIIFLGYYYLTEYTHFDVLTRHSFETILHPSFDMPSFVTIQKFLLELYLLLDVFWWSVFFMLVPTILMGASFPLISVLALSQRNKEGTTVGTVYFFNITGNVLGGLVTGFMLLPLLGTEVTLLVFTTTGILFALFASSYKEKYVPLVRRIIPVSVLLLVAIILFPKSGMLYKTMHVEVNDDFEFYLEEGVEGVVATYQKGERVLNYINGLGHGGRPLYRVYYEVLETLNFAPNPENALLIGFGTGSIAEAIQKSDQVKRLTLVELNGTLLNNLRKMPVFVNILDEPRMDVIVDDGRRLLLRSDKKFDLIMMDPLRTTTSYSNNIYSRQFFELVNERLSEDGIFLVWMDEHSVMPNTVNAVFDYVRVYSFFMLASNAPFERIPGRQEKILAQFSLAQRELILAEEAGKYVGDQDYIKETMSHYPINQDWKPVNEYYFGLKVRKKLFLNR